MGNIKYSYDKDGYDENGFTTYNQGAIHRDTGTEYNTEGFDKSGYNKDGYDRDGYDRDGYDKDGYNKYRIDREGYHKNGFNRRGFNRDGIHKKTGTEYDLQGYDKNGFNREGIYVKTKTKYDTDGYDKDGYDKCGRDRDGHIKKGYDEQGYNKKGQHIQGYNEEGYDINGYDRNGVDIEGINRNTGEKDERVKFAEEFISFGKSIEVFAKHKQISVEQAKTIIDEIRTSLIVKEKLERVLGVNSNRFLGIVKTKKEQLLTGKITISDVKGINSILGLCNLDERKKVTDMLIKAMASHEISILQYKDILGIKEINSSLPQNIITQIESLKRSAGPLARELYREMDRLKPYKAPYIANEGEALGYMEKPTDKKPKMVTITAEHRDMARQYLKATDEFICNKTMQSTLMKIIKGEIGIEQIVRTQKESELRRLQQEDGELGELIEQSEYFIKNSQGKTQTTHGMDDIGK